MNIVVLGSGGWGTAAAMLLSDNGHTVALWSHDPKKAELLDKTRENPLLKGVRIPERIAVTSDLAVLQNAEMAVFASPSFALRSVAHEAAPHLKKGTLLVSLTKGIERGTHLRMSEIIAPGMRRGLSYRSALRPLARRGGRAPSADGLCGGVRRSGERRGRAARVHERGLPRLHARRRRRRGACRRAQERRGAVLRHQRRLRHGRQHPCAAHHPRAE